MRDGDRHSAGAYWLPTPDSVKDHPEVIRWRVIERTPDVIVRPRHMPGQAVRLDIHEHIHHTHIINKQTSLAGTLGGTICCLQDLVWLDDNHNNDVDILRLKTLPLAPSQDLAWLNSIHRRR